MLNIEKEGAKTLVTLPRRYGCEFKIQNRVLSAKVKRGRATRSDIIKVHFFNCSVCFAGVWGTVEGLSHICIDGEAGQRRIKPE